MPSDLLLLLYGFITLLIQIAPWWLAGLLAGSLISVYLSDRIVSSVTALQQSRFGLVALVGAAFLGIASPLCLFGTIPLVAALGRKGVPQDILVAFMISSIMLNPNLLIISFVLGVPLALARFAVSLAAGILAGLLTKLFLSRQHLFRFDQFEPAQQKKKTFWRDFGKGLRITAPYLMIGILLTTLFDLYVPASLVGRLFGANRGLGVLLAVSLSIPTYICGGGTVPLLSAWLEAGMSVGSTIAFMVAGPATKLTNLGAVKIVLGLRNFMLYLGYCLFFAILAGFLADWIA
ncbi:MAG: permease [Bacillota bacterium]|nr:permease [Bacillota bacterium]